MSVELPGRIGAPPIEANILLSVVFVDGSLIILIGLASDAAGPAWEKNFSDTAVTVFLRKPHAQTSCGNPCGTFADAETKPITKLLLGSPEELLSEVYGAAQW